MAFMGDGRRGIEVGRNELDSKSSCPGDRARGFESHPLRQIKIYEGLCQSVTLYKDLLFLTLAILRDR